MREGVTATTLLLAMVVLRRDSPVIQRTTKGLLHNLTLED